MNNHEKNYIGPANEPELPKDISGVIDSLKERESERRRAVDLAFNQVELADGNNDEAAALKNLGNMLGVMEEFHGLFPELFGKGQSDD